MRHLLVGGSGYLGSALTRALMIDKRAQVTSIDVKPPSFEDDRLRYIEGDITDVEFMVRVRTEFLEHDNVYLLAAVVGRTTKMDFAELFKANYDPLIDIVMGAGKRSVVHCFSTASLFEGYASIVADEETVPRPIGGYAKLKWALENVVIRYSPRWKIYRIASCYGWSPAFSTGTLVNQLLDCAVSGRPSVISSPLTKVISISDIDDVVGFIARLSLEHGDTNDVINIASQDTSIADIVHRLAAMPGAKLRVTNESAAGHVNQYRLSNDKARQVYGFSPQPRLAAHFNRLLAERGVLV